MLSAIKAAILLTVWLLAPTAHADEWADLVTISSTQGLNANRLCMGAPGHPTDIGCPTNAPYLDTATGNIGIGTTSPGAELDVSGTVKASRIQVNTHAYIDNSTNAADGGYGMGIHSHLLITGVLAVGTGVGVNNIYRINTPEMVLTTSQYGTASLLGLGTSHPLTTLDVRGSLRLASEASATLAVCDTDRAGAIPIRSRSASPPPPPPPPSTSPAASWAKPCRSPAETATPAAQTTSAKSASTADAYNSAPIKMHTSLLPRGHPGAGRDPRKATAR